MITPFSSVFKFGIPLAVILMVQFYFTAKETIATQDILPSYITMIQVGIVFVTVLLSATDHRKKFTGRAFKFAEGVGCGVLTSAMAGIFFAILIFVYLYFNPEVGKALKEISLKHMPAGMPKDTFKLTPIKESALASVQTFIQTFLIGLISSIIVGVILRKKSVA